MAKRTLFQGALLAAALFLLTALPSQAALTVLPTAGASASAYSGLERLVLDRVGGDLASPGGRVLVNADGSRTTQSITAEEFLAHARSALRDLPADLAPRGATQGTPGVGLGDMNLAAAMAWPYCEHGASWVSIYFAPAAGVTVKSVDQAPDDVNAQKVCAGKYGDTHTYIGLEFDAVGVRGVYGWLGCAVAPVLPGAELGVGRGGGYLCSGVQVGRMQGNVALSLLNIGGISLDYAVGDASAVEVGVVV